MSQKRKKTRVSWKIYLKEDTSFFAVKQIFVNKYLKQTEFSPF